VTVFTKSHRNPSRTEQAATEEKRVLLHEPREIRTVEVKRANEEYVFRRNPTSVSGMSPWSQYSGSKRGLRQEGFVETRVKQI